MKSRSNVLALLAAALLAVPWLGGCSVGQPELEIPIAEFLPADWVTVGNWQEVNIDSDTPPEYLIFFTYNGGNSNGENNPGAATAPVGALIYDSQADEGQGVDFKSYRLLPAYRAGTGQGFVAEPAQRDALGIFPISRTDPAEVRQTPSDPAVTTTLETQAGSGADELVILGGNTVLTVVWWQGGGNGYGITQVYAPGGLHYINDPAGERDRAWAGNGPITSLHGYFPLEDRSLLCYEKLYVRTLDPEATPPGAYRPAIRYQELPLGLRFCHAMPVHPFYPEGVVLAYLLNPSVESHLLHPNLAEAERARLAQFIEERADVARGRVQVEDVRAYRTVERVEGVESPELTTSACASIMSKEDGPISLLFTLRHQPPDAEGEMPDRFYVTNVNEIPAPPGGPVVHCGDIIENGVPERRWSP